MLALLPVVCQSQTPNAAASFGDMPDKVKAGQVVIVIDEAGRETRGKVAEVSGSSLVILTRDPNRQWANRAEFAPASVREVKRTGPIWDGALIGFGIGVVPGLFVEDCTGCMSKGAVALMLGGIGAGIGLGIDAAFGPKQVYLAPGTRRAEVLLAPLIGRNRHGASVALRF
jgi:hypothetical protein